MSVQLEPSSSCPSRLDASVTSHGLGSLGDHFRWILCSTEGTKREAEQRMGRTGSVTFYFLWKHLEKDRSQRTFHPWAILPSPRAFQDPPFIGCLVSSLYHQYVPIKLFWVLVHAVTQYEELSLHPSLTLRIPGCPSTPAQVPSHP